MILVKPATQPVKLEPNTKRPVANNGWRSSTVPTPASQSFTVLHISSLGHQTNHVAQSLSVFGVSHPAPSFQRHLLGHLGHLVDPPSPALSRSLFVSLGRQLLHSLRSLFHQPRTTKVNPCLTTSGSVASTLISITLFDIPFDKHPEHGALSTGYLRLFLIVTYHCSSFIGVASIRYPYLGNLVNTPQSTPQSSIPHLCTPSLHAHLALSLSTSRLVNNPVAWPVLRDS